MSIQAIAGLAFDRRNPNDPTTAARLRIANEQAARAAQDGQPSTTQQSSAEKVNAAFEFLKRYFPTELVGLYLPFVAITIDHFKADGPCILVRVYVGFVVATPLLVWMLYIAKSIEAKMTWSVKELPLVESALATIAFAIWGASVPGVFPAQQWWLGLVALVSTVLLPLLDAVFGKKSA